MNRVHAEKSLAECSLWPDNEDDIFFYYDGPLTFMTADRNGNLWLLYIHDRDREGGEASFLCFPLTERESLADLLSGATDIHSFMLSQKEAWLGIWSLKDELQRAKPIAWTDSKTGMSETNEYFNIPVCELPDKGVLLPG